MKTAVEWFFNELQRMQYFIGNDMLEAYKEAKEMEKKQIINANEDASTNELGEFLTGEQYYNEEYGK